MKKIISLLMALTIIVVLAACGSNSDTKDNASGSSASNTASKDANTANNSAAGNEKLKIGMSNSILSIDFFCCS
ncbi:hypothetical protein [Cohnella kolymensis]|uniref:hypothetical protein n=1 Tax=Cohnella kolymensis TaxID=1590652 RepID=UPI001269C6B0|nr:hypothetical protein [Cohnella kolymensis]